MDIEKKAVYTNANCARAKMRSISRRTSKRLLPAHFGEEVVSLRSEVGDLRALFVALRLCEHAVARLYREVLACVGNREHDLLQRAVVAHDLLSACKLHYLLLL